MDNIPKIAWIPIMSVKKADTKIIPRVIVIIIAVGCPFSKLPERRAIHLKAQRTGSRRKITNPTAVSNTQSAVSPLPAFTSATVRARRIQPTT